VAKKISARNFIKMTVADKKILDTALVLAPDVLKELTEGNAWCGVSDVEVDGQKHPILFAQMDQPWPTTTIRGFPFPVRHLNNTSIEYYIFLTRPNVHPALFKTGEQIRELVPATVRALGDHPTEQHMIELEFQVTEPDQKWVN